MKKLISIFCFFYALSSFCQSSTGANGEFIDGVFTPANIYVGDTSKLKITVANGIVTAGVGEVTVIINFPNNGSYLDVTPAVGPMPDTLSAPFSWLKVPDTGGSATWVGTNTTPLGEFDGGVFTFRVKGINFTVGDITIISGLFVEDNAEDNPDLKVNSIPLPVTLSSFKGQADKCDPVVLTWTTESEVNNKGFAVERSFDGKSYFEIGFVESSHNSIVSNTYTYIDKEDFGGLAYYRLIATDFDGKSEKFILDQAIEKNCFESEIRLYPNPAISNVNFFYSDVTDDSQNAELLDVDGKLIKTVKVSPNKTVAISLSEIKSGVYNLRFSRGGKQVLKRFIKIE